MMIETLLPVTEITYKQASEILGIPVDTLKHAVGRGMLTPLPRQGLERHLISEQVELFKGKRISLATLTKEQKEVWKKYREIATGTASTQIDIRGIAYSPDFVERIEKAIERAGVAAMERFLQACQKGEVPQGVSFFDMLGEVFGHIGKSAYLMFLYSTYRNGNVSEDYIRSVIDAMPAKEREQAIDTINSTDELKPLREIVTSQ